MQNRAAPPHGVTDQRSPLLIRVKWGLQAGMQALTNIADQPKNQSGHFSAPVWQGWLYGLPLVVQV